MVRALRIRHVLLVGLLALGCRKEEPTPSTTGGDAGTAKTPDTPPVPAAPKFDRLVPREMPAQGAREGLVDGAMIHAGVRLSAAVPWLRSLPLPGDVARELAEFSEASGVDWRAENLERRFALADGAVLTMSLLRPLDAGLADLRGELSRGGGAIDGLSAVRRGSKTALTPAPIPSEMPSEPPVVPPPAPGEPPPISPPIVPTVEPSVTPEPPPIAEADLERGRALDEIAGGLGLHSRFAIPVTDPRPIVEHLRSRVPAAATTRWAEVCTAAVAAFCFGEDDVVAIVRGTETAVILDMVLFVTDADTIGPARRKAVLDAVAIAGSTTDHDLRGDASAVIDAAKVLVFAELDAVRRSISTSAYESGPERDRSIAEFLDGSKALADLMSAPQLFRGARLSALVDGEDLHAELRYLLVPGQADAVTTAFAGASADAPVPTLAALCDGSLFCVRTAGLPKPSTLADRLGVGPWSRGPDAVDRAVGRSEDALWVHVFAASWPSLLGSIARLPSLEAGGGPEAMIVRNLVDMVGRVQGIGGSLRSASFSGRRITGDYVVYARTNDSDAGVPKAMLSLAGMGMTEVALTGELGKASAFTVPEDDVPMTLMSRVDPATKSGWLTVVDGPDRLSWLLGLPNETYLGPGVYAEIPDLARLVATVPEAARELSAISGFLERRSLRMTAEFDDGEALVRAALVRTK